MDLTPEHMRLIVLSMIVLIASIAVHEFGHAFVADRLGDDLPRRQGRVTLNPVAHADLIGTIFLPLIGMVYTIQSGYPAGFGWGKPVQVRPEKFSRKYTMATGHMMVALAGPMMNILLGTLLVAVHVTLMASHVVAPGSEPSLMLWSAQMLNFTLFFFNLVPAPPLDGGWVMARFIPYKYRPAYERYMTYGPFVVMALVMISPLRKVFTVPAQFVSELLYRGFGALAGM